MVLSDDPVTSRIEQALAGDAKLAGDIGECAGEICNRRCGFERGPCEVRRDHRGELIQLRPGLLRPEVAGPKRRFCVRSVLLPMRKPCLLHGRGANSARIRAMWLQDRACWFTGNAMYLDIQEVLARIGPADRVLDLGGWERVFPRADVVVDLNPYETRKVIHGNIPERFTRNTWIRADFCRPAFWETIGDNTFDFIIVSHTLEDVRDPLYLCSQIIRCGKAGYIEVPSKFRECAKITATDSFAGYDHHRWIIEPMPDRTGLIFKAKLSWAHHQDYLGDARRHFLRSYHYHFNGFFWHGSFRYLEHFPKGSVLESTDLVWFYEHLVYDRAPDIIFDLVPNSSHPSDGSCLWVTEYRLPSEPAPDAASHPQSPALHV